MQNTKLMERYVPEPRRKKRLPAAFMAFMLGTFGVHKFYLNNQGAGVFFIMLFVMSINLFGFPISSLLGFIDAMKLFNMTDEEFDHKYNTKSVRTGQRYNRGKRGRNRVDPDFRRKSKRKKTNESPRRKVKTGILRKENAFVKTGIQKYKNFDLDDAILDFKKGIEIDPSNVALHFNIACAYSLTEQKDKAYEHLSKAVVYGLKDTSKINTHEDLAFVRIQPEYNNFKENGYQSTISKSKTTTSIKDTNVNNDLLSRLNKLAELRKRGLLSEKEFHMEKEKLMS